MHKQWGRENPYFGVLTDPRFRGTTVTPDARNDFFASGERQIAEVLTQAEHAFGPITRRYALDYGCGVGRLILPLAARFEHVVGADSSTAMLREASKNLKGSDSVTLIHTADAKALTGSFDFVHSASVFQHIPEKHGMAIIARLAASLAPGGVGAVHLPVHRNIRTAHRIIHYLRMRVRPFHALLNLCQSRPWRDAPIGHEIYSLSRIASLLRGAGIRKFIAELWNTQDRSEFAFLYFQRPL